MTVRGLLSPCPHQDPNGSILAANSHPLDLGGCVGQEQRLLRPHAAKRERETSSLTTYWSESTALSR